MSLTYACKPTCFAFEVSPQDVPAWFSPLSSGTYGIGAFADPLPSGCFGRSLNLYTNLYIVLSASKTRLVQVHINPSNGNMLLFSFLDGGTSQVDIWLNASNQIEARRGSVVLATAPLVLYLNQWHLIQAMVTIDSTAGIVTMNVDRSGATTVGSLNTQVTANASSTTVTFVNSAYLFTNLHIMDTLLSATTEPLPPQLIAKPLLATANGAEQDFTPSTGSAYQCINTPSNDSKNISSSTAGAKSTFVIGPLGAGGSYQSVWWYGTVVRGKISTAGVATASALTRLGGVDYLAAPVPLLSAFGDQVSAGSQVRPSDSAPWALTDAPEAGVMLVSNT